MTCRLADATSTASEMPAASVSALCLTPPSARSNGLGSFFLPSGTVVIAPFSASPDEHEQSPEPSIGFHYMLMRRTSRIASIAIRLGTHARWHPNEGLLEGL